MTLPPREEPQRRSTTPATLAEAHAMLLRQRPKLDAEPLAWVAFHRRSAEVFAEVAKTDKDHRYEAQFWVGHEIRQARVIEDRLAVDNND